MSPQAIAPILFLLLGEPTMAQPPAFDAPYNFNDDAVVQPAKLQTTVMEIEATLDATLYNLALIQRDDGALANGIVTTDSLSPAVLTEFANAAQAVYASNLAAISAQQATNTSNIGTLTTQQGVNTSAISGLDTRVGVLETSQAAQDAQIAINKANGDQVPALSQSNSDVLAYLAINTDYNPSGLSAFRFDPADYSEGDIASFNSSTGNFEPLDLVDLAEIELNVSSAPEVAGSNYNTLADARTYALSKLQYGGKLKINVAAETINETTQFSIDSRFNVVIEGASAATSTISTTSNFSVKSSRLEIKNVTISSPSSATVNAEEGSYVLFAGTDIQNSSDVGTALALYNSQAVANGTFSGGSAALLIVDHSTFTHIGSQSNPSNTLTLNTDASFGQTLVNLNGMSTAYFNTLSLNSTNASLSTGIHARGGSRVIISGSVSDNGNIDTLYNPAADTYGNHYSRIITTP